ncbi:MAG: fibrobacter succinogenes major paralogous domain-containing protein [Flavobacteriales bacterium]|nr:fibrobacter succinogenes major paralogous domain-containing protein [Flavobacteriales bacterium]
MKRLLVLLVLAPLALTAQDNPNYNPDYDGDGCYSVNDILGLLPLFGTCDPFLCGDSVLFDGYYYKTVLIGDQCWFKENLRTTIYSNGTVIPADLLDDEWETTTSGAAAIYGEGSSACSHSSPDFSACDEALSLAYYGRLYNWYAVVDARGLCPLGWHVPTDQEWTYLDDYITSQGFEGIEGTALKSTTGWGDNSNGTDNFGFSGVPGGGRLSAPGSDQNGRFNGAGSGGSFWSSTATGPPETQSPESCQSWMRRLLTYETFLGRRVSFKRSGRSVRCLKDAE